MLSLDEIEWTWSLIDTPDLSKHDLRVRELDELEFAGQRPLFAVDSQRHRQLLMPVNPDRSLQEDTASAGVQVISRQLLDSGKTRQFAVLICLKPHLNELFSIIVSEVLSDLQSDPGRPDIVAVQVLNRWREMLEKTPSGMPPPQTIIGLFGELWQLKQICLLEPQWTQYWTGPLGTVHDIANDQIALEVKASASSKGRQIIVHGLEQLTIPQNGELFLAAMKLQRTSPDRGENLTDLVNAVLKVGGNRGDILKSLAAAGVTMASLEECADICFAVEENSIYRIDQTFPRITEADLVRGELPPQIVKMTYQVDLSHEPPHPLADEEAANFYSYFSSRIN